ncbi:DUF3324 domain-containing protein [Xylocopilactobacillus apis]|uniref:Cell wall surface anchor protein n=1 Tax=Xylocopilactobacillus apis TaxID=2932183 RepID=A0AAU9CTJ9_9LACO|nr:DUF3324 domain-containing protein [Xylocopilactobacillus apis]BDR57292.1 cell wall surface anchor protein [Xylocopilactobacillus apis]
MSSKKKQLGLVVFSLLLLLIQFIPVKKAQADVETDPKKFATLSVPFFTVKIVPPANQAKGTTINYFDLRVKPGMKQTLELYVASTAKKSQTITMTPTNAITSAGNILASGVKVPPDPSNIIPFTSFGIRNATITLKPKEVKTVKISYTMPETPFDGIMIGGLFLNTSLTTTSDAGKSKNQKATLKFLNDYSMAIQVLMTETDKLVLSDLKVKTIIPQSYQTLPAVGVKLQNPKMQYMDGLSLDATVTRLADPNDRHTQKVKDYKFAPTSNFTYMIPWKSTEKMEAGKYRLDLKAKAVQSHLALNEEQQKKQKWNISREFTITKAQADQINRKNPKYKTDYTWLFIIIGILIVLLIIFLFWLVFTLGRKKTNKNVVTKE